MWPCILSRMKKNVRYKHGCLMFIVIINTTKIFCAWPVRAETTYNLGKSDFSSPIDRHLNIQITAWPKLGKVQNIGNNSAECTSSYFTVVKVSFENCTRSKSWKKNCVYWKNILRYLGTLLVCVPPHLVISCLVLPNLAVSGSLVIFNTQ